MSDINAWIAVGAGGALGAVVRGGVYRFIGARILRDVSRRAGRLGLARATLLVNVAGSFLLGIGIALFAALPADHATRIFWMTGFCGSVTTFSSFCADAVRLAGEGDRMALFAYLLANGVLSLLALSLGLSVVSKLAS